MDKKHTYPFGIVGNCSYMSYIDNNANVVWQCWPHFDSSFIFGSLISDSKGGEFSITPANKFSSTQKYLQNTNILVTHFTSQDGEFRVIDFAPRFHLFERYHKPLMLFRKIEIVKGTPMVRVKCNPMGNYGQIKAIASPASNSINYEVLSSKVRLTSNVPKTNILEEKAFPLTESKYLVLSWGTPLEAPLERTYEDFLSRTKEYWRHWIRCSSIPNIYQKDVIRSALLLKLHQDEDTGAIIASGTTSLPEHPKSGRNWDYRYCWIRDSYFTLTALISLGHFAEAERYSHWIQTIVQNASAHYQPVYKINGDEIITETELTLEGYQGNQPVRIGNDAYKQVQHDVYGQMLLSLEPLYTDLRVYKSNSRPSIKLVDEILDRILSVMDSPDAGIWEFRATLQKHAESYLFHWAGANAAIKIAKSFESISLEKKAREVMKLSQENIEKCYDQERQAYGSSQENKNLNASEFLLITMNYLKDPEKASNHIRALENELKISKELIYRYRNLDDFGETRSTFLICGFWYAEALAKIDEIDKAREVFEALLKHSNHLGIFSEDICPKDGSQWGNIAQTYSHVGLINTAFKISRKLDRPGFLAK